MSNIKKIQDMVSGKYKERVSIGYEGKTTNQRKEGEEWVDARGRRWTIEDGKRKQITKVPPRGFDKCNGWEGSDCEKLILKTIDQETYNRMGRCRICQIEFEADLHRKGEWVAWRDEQEKKRWESILAEYEQEMSERKESLALKLDKKVANAIAKESHR
tara:strand:- start:875 stop:1351 length:477 start_codon:yes stop_codon:yes gene_type:complete